MMAARESTTEQIAEALHGLCQPLTALQCRLEIGRMQEQAGTLRMGTGATETAVWSECLAQCGRLNSMVEAMRILVQQALSEMPGRNG